jgi:hypothetical protein
VAVTSSEDIKTLKDIQKLFVTNNNEICLTGSFFRAFTESIVTKPSDPMSIKALNALNHINSDVWNICRVDRIEWFRNYAIAENIEKTKPFVWHEYTSIDIEYFFTQIRSILDYVATVINALADKPGELPESFNDLYTKLTNNPSTWQPKLGEPFCSVIKSASWYKEVRTVRDNLIHHGSDTFVFGRPEDGILFQVMRGLKGSILIEQLMWNEYVVDFRLYAALYFSKLLFLLEQIGNIILERLQSSTISSGPWVNFSGLSILAEWINQLVEKLEATNSSLT